MAAHHDFDAEQSATGVFDHRKRFGHDFSQGVGQLLIILDGGDAGLPLGGFLAQGFIGQGLEAGLDFVDFGNKRPQALHFAVIFRADDFLYDQS